MGAERKGVFDAFWDDDGVVVFGAVEVEVEDGPVGVDVPAVGEERSQ